ncbi:MAG: hypothetical protein WC714_28890 [Candidatus Obscuribacterales bacterium]|jgi:hypothetical protein
MTKNKVVYIASVSNDQGAFFRQDREWLEEVGGVSALSNRAGRA